MRNLEIVTSTSRIWVSDDSIVRLVNCSRAEQTIAHARENVDAVWRLALGRHLPLYVDMTLPAAQTWECRKYYTGSAAAADCISAVGILAISSLGRVIGNFVIGVNPTKVPIRLFESEPVAVHWLRGFRDQQEAVSSHVA